jgi:hypothetical protein
MDAQLKCIRRGAATEGAAASRPLHQPQKKQGLQALAFLDTADFNPKGIER